MTEKTRRRRSVGLKLAPLLLAPVLLAGCAGGIEEAQQRDVYTRFEDCMADWGEKALCQQLGAQEKAEVVAQATGVTGGNSGGSSFIFWGPNYYPGDRGASYNGREIYPSTNRAMSRPYTVNQYSSAAAKSSPAKATSKSISRGGFGSTGRGFSGGG